MGSLRPTCRPGKLRTREYSLSLGLTNRTLVILTECLTTDTSLAYTSPTGQNLTEHFAPPLYLGLYLKQIQVTMSAEHRCHQYLLITSPVHMSQTPTTPPAEVGLPHPSGTPTSPLQQLQTPPIGLCLYNLHHIVPAELWEVNPVITQTSTVRFSPTRHHSIETKLPETS